MKQQFILALSIFCSGCGSFWGEKPTGPRTLLAPTGQLCPPFTEILRGSKLEANVTLGCWTNQIRSALAQVEGDTKGSLSKLELNSLVERRVLNLGGTPGADREKLSAILRVLGFQRTVKKGDVEGWLEFLSTELPALRDAHEILLAGFRAEHSYAKLQSALSTFRRIFERIPSEFQPHQLSQDLVAILGPATTSWVGPTVQFLTELSNALCPTSGARHDTVSPLEFSKCLTDLAIHFEGTQPWWDWELGPQDKIPDPLKIQQALKAAEPAAQAWFGRERFSDAWLSTDTTLKWIAALGVEAPKDFTDSLTVLKRLGRKSTPSHLHPADLPALVKLLVDIRTPVIKVLPDYLIALWFDDCVTPVKHWTECIPKDISRKLESSRFEMLNLAYSPDSQTLVAPPSGKRFAEISLVWTLAHRILRAFDSDKNGVLSASIGEGDHNEAANLISVMLRSGELASGLITNIDRKLRGLEPLKYTSNNFVSNLDLPSLAKVVTLAGTHSLVHRSRKQTNALDDVLENLINLFPRSSIHLDQAGISGVLNTILLLPRFEMEVLKKIFGDLPLDLGTIRLSRAALVDGLSKAMIELFPKSSRSCKEFGIHENCGNVFERFLPPEDILRPMDLDPAILIALMLEGTFFHCDDDWDGELSLNLIKGDDELDCGYVKLKDIVIRLAESKLLPLTNGGRRKMTWLLEFFNSTTITRTFGKVALARGTLDFPFINPILMPFYGTATLGSIYSLILELTQKE